MQTPDQPGSLSRRAVLGGLGAGIVGAGLLGVSSTHATPVSASDRAATQRAQGSVPLTFMPTALDPVLRYVPFGAYDFRPASSTPDWNTDGGAFKFAPGSSGDVTVALNLPFGSVVREIQVYGTRNPGGAVSVEAYRTSFAHTGVEQIGSVAVPSAAGDFVATLPLIDRQDETGKVTPIIRIDPTAAMTTSLTGMRVAYAPATGFLRLPPGVPPRVLDTREGSTKLAAQEERTIALPVPPGVAAVLNLTLTQTEGGGDYVAVFPADTVWPGNSSVNYSGPNQDIANTVLSAVSADSKITLRGGAANRTHVIIDVAGWIA